MEDDNASSSGGEAVVVGVKSWLAYLPTLFGALILFGLLLPLIFSNFGELPAAGFLLLGALLAGYRIAQLRSVQLYYDAVGVWVVSGILPWTRGVSGVKWRDMDEASYQQGFLNWITRSYDVRIGHRFTKASEIRLTKIARGRHAIEAINSYHQKLIRDRVID